MLTDISVEMSTDIQYRANVSWQSRLETQSSMLEAIEDRASRFEARVSSFETLEDFSRISIAAFEETFNFSNLKQ